ncbi:MAG: hypothetical protein HKO13_09340 [Sphingomonas sp.]|nr:hypothetical protein [Sphingomonas sp.]
MSGKLRTKEFRKLLVDFGETALECADCQIDDLDFNRFKLHNGYGFQISDSAIEQQAAFTAAALKALGPEIGHAKIIDRALWDFVVAHADEGIPKDAVTLYDALDSIEAKSASVVEWFRPCPLVRLPVGVENVSIGPVSIHTAEARIAEFRQINENFKFAVGKGWALDTIAIGKEVGIVTQLPPLMWSISLTVADPLRDQEALWLVDIAVSLLRLTIDADQLGLLAPSVGKLEPHPFIPHDNRNHAFALKQAGGGQLGGMTAANIYELSDAAVSGLNAESCKKKFDQVFNSSASSLGARFYQGCGWLTRGRRSRDRSDRLLYFFTAIEALLSDSDKSAPVIQNISRRAAVLLSDDNKERSEIARSIKSLYGIRSALVHTGSRRAFESDSNNAQIVAELLFQKVWEELDLKMSHQRFCENLGRATFGLTLTSVLKGESQNT